MNDQPIVSAGQRTVNLAAQVRQIQARYPDLYNYLTARDRAIERALARIPSRADIELSSVFNARAYLEKAMGDLAPDIAELSEEEQHWTRKYRP